MELRSVRSTPSALPDAHRPAGQPPEQPGTAFGKHRHGPMSRRAPTVIAWSSGRATRSWPSFRRERRPAGRSLRGELGRRRPGCAGRGGRWPKPFRRGLAAVQRGRVDQRRVSASVSTRAPTRWAAPFRSTTPVRVEAPRRWRPTCRATSQSSSGLSLSRPEYPNVVGRRFRPRWEPTSDVFQISTPATYDFPMRKWPLDSAGFSSPSGRSAPDSQTNPEFSRGVRAVADHQLHPAPPGAPGQHGLTASSSPRTGGTAPYTTSLSAPARCRWASRSPRPVSSAAHRRRRFVPFHRPVTDSSTGDRPYTGRQQLAIVVTAAGFTVTPAITR